MCSTSLAVYFFQQYLLVTISCCPDSADFLPFMTLGSTPGVDRQLLPLSDDGCSGAIFIDDGFPFGGFSETQVYVRKHPCKTPYNMYDLAKVAFPLQQWCNTALIA